jgi:hypothetical protein
LGNRRGARAGPGAQRNCPIRWRTHMSLGLYSIARSSSITIDVRRRALAPTTSKRSRRWKAGADTVSPRQLPGRGGPRGRRSTPNADFRVGASGNVGGSERFGLILLKRRGRARDRTNRDRAARPRTRVPLT